jgi:hypothetical protein
VIQCSSTDPPSRSVHSVTPLSSECGGDKLSLIIGPLVTLSAEQSVPPSDGTGDVQGEKLDGRPVLCQKKLGLLPSCVNSKNIFLQRISLIS